MPGYNSQRRVTVRTLPYYSLFVLFCCYLCFLCIVCVYMCTVLLPPGGYPIANNKHIISYIASHRIVPYRTVPYRTVSYHIISYHIISYHIISYHIISYHIISYHIISYHIISYHIVSYHIMYHNILYHISSYHITYHIIIFHPFFRLRFHRHKPIEWWAQLVNLLSMYFSPVSCHVRWDPHVSVIILFWNTLSLCCSFSLRGHVSKPQEILNFCTNNMGTKVIHNKHCNNSKRGYMLVTLYLQVFVTEV